MKNLKRNKGFSLVNLILALVVLGCVGIFGFQIGIAYMNQNSIKGAVKTTLLEAKSSGESSTSAIESSIEKKLSVGTIELNKDNISITRETSGFQVDVEYIKEVKISDKIKLVINLSFIEKTPN